MLPCFTREQDGCGPTCGPSILAIVAQTLQMASHLARQKVNPNKRFAPETNHIPSPAFP
ncbi:MAG: hypothetical protein NZ653_01325 [Anaerolineae bacterium]|nr:hypothetical protein [Anaerolineae bacterium]